MPIEFKCQYCGKQLRTPDNSAGKKGRCPHCQNLMQIPAASTKQEEQAATDPFHDVLGPTQKPEAAPLKDDLFGSSESPDPLGGAASMQPPAGFASGPAQPANPYAAPSYGGAAGFASGHGSYRPHRGGMVLTLGIISVVMVPLGFLACCCCVPANWAADLITLGLAIPAAIVGHVDLKAMRDGQMDPSGRGMTQTGYIMAIIAAVMAIVFLVLSIVLFAMGMGAQMMQNMPKM